MAKPLRIATYILVSFCVLLFFSYNTDGQSFKAVRSEVVTRLLKLKPQNKKRVTYKLAVPRKPRELPQNLQLDLVYKIGHYEFEYVVLRFERHHERPSVDATMFSFGSALKFWTEYSKYAKGDGYIAKIGQLPNEVFDKLVEKAVLLFDSSITKIERPIIKFDKRRGIVHVGGFGSTSITSSSGDGHVIFQISNLDSPRKTVISDQGSLVGSLESRKSNGYDYLRANTIWEVFDAYLEKKDFLVPLENKEAEKIIINRLNEPNLTTDYADYFRQAALVKILGEIGTTDSLPTLLKVINNNGLEDSWSTYLSEIASDSILKINSRNQTSHVTKP